MVSRERNVRACIIPISAWITPLAAGAVHSGVFVMQTPKGMSHATVRMIHITVGMMHVARRMSHSVARMVHAASGASPVAAGMCRISGRMRQIPGPGTSRQGRTVRGGPVPGAPYRPASASRNGLSPR